MENQSDQNQAPTTAKTLQQEYQDALLQQIAGL
jgi:hypothetical protein